jgi:hypothetical protein
MRAAAILLLLAGPALAEAPAGSPPANAPSLSTPAVNQPPPPPPCDTARHPGLPEGPIAIGLGDADFATARRACPRTEVTIAGRGGAIIDTPNFYGALAVDALIAASVAIDRRAELFGTLDVLHWQFVQNATIKGSDASLGQLTLGGSFIAASRARWAASPWARLLLPTSTASAQARTFGAEVGIAATLRPREWLEFHAAFAGDASFAVGVPAGGRSGLTLVGGAQLAPFTWLALALDLELAFGHLAGLDRFAPALAVRLRPYRGFSIELAAVVPVAGADRHDGVALLRLANRF